MRSPDLEFVVSRRNESLKLAAAARRPQQAIVAARFEARDKRHTVVGDGLLLRRDGIGQKL